MLCELCVVVWLVGKEWMWYISYIKERVNDQEYIVDYLERVKDKIHNHWKYPYI